MDDINLKRPKLSSYLLPGLGILILIIICIFILACKNPNDFEYKQDNHEIIEQLLEQNLSLHNIKDKLAEIEQKTSGNSIKNLEIKLNDEKVDESLTSKNLKLSMDSNNQDPPKYHVSKTAINDISKAIDKHIRKNQTLIRDGVSGFKVVRVLPFAMLAFVIVLGLIGLYFIIRLYITAEQKYDDKENAILNRKFERETVVDNNSLESFFKNLEKLKTQYPVLEQMSLMGIDAIKDP